MSFTALKKAAEASNPKTPTPQNRPSNKTSVPQVQNSAGGFVFQVSKESKLDRFLIIGTSGGTAYSSEKDITSENIVDVIELIRSKGEYVVSRIVEISSSGRARKNDYALYALALCYTHGNDKVKALAHTHFNEVVRTGTDLFHFVEFANNLRGWGRSLKKSVASWYTKKTDKDLAFQMMKYKQRDGWSHVDVMRIAHPKPGNGVARANLFKFVAKGAAAMKKGDIVPEIVVAVEQAKSASTAGLISLIGKYRLTHEMIPNEQKGDIEVWKAMLPHMGITALIRNLNKMTALGLNTALVRTICEKLTNEEAIKKSLVHPFQIFVGKNIYESGKGEKGELRWNPNRDIIKALEFAFYASFKNVQPSNKKTMICLDVSGSMWMKGFGSTGLPGNVFPGDAAAILAMASIRAETKPPIVMAFSDKLVRLNIKDTDTLSNVLTKMRQHNFGRTDCALPMVYAKENKLDIETFNIYTDNETWFGKIHPFEALKQYRASARDIGSRSARMAVVGMVSNKFSIADPSDAGMLDVVGFDTATPAILADFSAGRI